nr:MAG TPA: hypothetical protein [Caudoviricetes sp.]
MAVIRCGVFLFEIIEQTNEKCVSRPTLCVRVKISKGKEIPPKKRRYMSWH